MKKFIINFTPTGIIPTKEMTTHVPVSSDEIIREVIEAKTLGASIIHLHARDKHGNPTWQKSEYKKIIDGIRKFEGYNNQSLIICVSTSGRNWPDFERRSECLELEGNSKPDMASLTLSSLNFQQAASVNQPQMIQKLAAKMLENGIKPELEAFDAGMINYSKYMFKKELIQPPFYFNLLFGNIFNAQAELSEAGLMLAQLPENSVWAFGGLGMAQLKMNVTALLYGGGIRIGLEDNIYFDDNKQVLASNIDLIKRFRKIADLMDFMPYSSGEVRKMLNLEIE